MQPSQNIIQGSHSYKSLSAELEHYSPGKIFLVTGNSSFSSSGAEELLLPIIERYSYFNYKPQFTNSNIKDLYNAVKAFRDQGCDMVIGIGGGSILDLAKAVSGLYGSVEDIEEIVKTSQPLPARSVPSLMVPTTAGTGSESTQYSVVYIGNTKYSLSDGSLLPDVAILDPLFIQNCPVYFSACAAMDALCQAIESYWSVRSTDQSREYSRRAIELILPNIVNAVINRHPDALEAMLIASNFSGKAISIAQTTIAHSVSYPLTAYFDVPHGQAVAITLPSFFLMNSEVSSCDIQDTRGLDHARGVMEDLVCMLGCRTASEVKGLLTDLLARLALASRLSEFGISESTIELLVANGFNPQRAKNNPRAVSETMLRELLSSLL